ncbi:short-chain dehydrogenase/reductase SDR [Amycolatopsis mediterranei S699]|uniref:Short-chain dehydrogenase/reductase SDR n=2 Tax=Amycolatopsis mediterranei TaxID=33910 RepID=A0A0H3DLI7_AMYMU|nr:SDR family oxidoreductase [Amycolatopsis mediterranei]ADJ50579.1 short-chain dehydrogenase/reductase SDR [Amycolatopsis mediterranei U32]AEK47585.1 short-chain dehydrogenase/reductase SDR [Amycolatopsis mediterranei S699]AFO82285.1 short-chain dehydrogenase/reductase SDR [Amycolatopsis mediterranei S699]AGT89414.1 short-chain dehydrogenase/reductase SDR [Amycolatopsis mediterranei RB]KDO09237.1 short-chain dehydrogenase [Amycolatopsis mediterranei]
MNELSGKVALVAGGTRGASRAIAVELGRAGAFVYVTGRTTRAGRSEVDRPETIEETAELIERAGGAAEAIRVDHLVPAEVEALAKRIERLDILIDGLWGGDRHLGWGKPVWEHDLDAGLRMIRLGIDAHLITSHYLLPLLIGRPGGLVVELTDGTAEYNAKYRVGTSLPFYLAKASAHLLAIGEAAELASFGAAAVAFTPGYLRSEAMLEIYGVTEENWRDACERVPHFAISETPTFCGRTVVALAADPERDRWSGQTVSSGQLAKEYGVDDVDGSRPDAWRYMTEVADAGKPADTTGYR